MHSDLVGLFTGDRALERLTVSLLGAFGLAVEVFVEFGLLGCEFHDIDFSSVNEREDCLSALIKQLLEHVKLLLLLNRVNLERVIIQEHVLAVRLTLVLVLRVLGSLVALPRILLACATHCCHYLVLLGLCLLLLLRVTDLIKLVVLHYTSINIRLCQFWTLVGKFTRRIVKVLVRSCVLLVY